MARLLNRDRRRAARVAIVAVLATVAAGAAAGTARADDGGAGFATAEFAVLGEGASAGWRGALAGAGTFRQRDGGGGVPDEFGTSRRAQEAGASGPDGPSNFGRKLKAGALSAVLPGAGQYYNGDRRRAFVMAGIEAGIWTAYFVFDAQGDDRMESARQWAGIYAGVGGDGERGESYWQAVGQFMDSDAYNDSRYREARALQEPVSGLVGPDDAWQWVNNDRRYSYALLRSKGNSAYDRRDFMILFAVLNRAVSVFDAVTGVRDDGELAGVRVLGLDVALEIEPALRDPGARCVVSRGF